MAALASSRFSKEAKIALVSSLGLACFNGDVATVRATFEAAGLKDQAELLRRRHTAWRLTPLALCIAGSRFVDVAAAGGPIDNYGVARVLLDAGAPIEARDALGHSSLHWATSRTASPISLRIAGAKRHDWC